MNNNEEKIYDKIAVNSFYNFLKGIIVFIITIILPPTIIYFIGIEGYGIWALLQFMIFYGTFVDLGINATITKYTAEYEARKDTDFMLKLFNTFFVIYFFASLLLFILVFLSKDWLVKIFFKTQNYGGQDISTLLLITCAVFGIQTIFSVYPSFLNGLQRMDITNKVVIILSSSNLILSIIFLALGFKIYGLIWAYFLSLMIGILITVNVCSKIAPYIKISPSFSKEIFLKVFQFNLFSAIGSISSVIHLQFNKLIVSYFLGLNFLAYYDISQKVATLPWVALQYIITPIMPAVSNIYKKIGIERIKEISENTLSCVYLISFPVFIFLSIFSDITIEFWLGKGYGMVSLALKFLAIAYFISILTGPGSAILTGMGLPKVPVYSGILTAFFNIAIVIILIKTNGFIGLLVGTISSYLFGAIYFFYSFHKVIPMEIKKVFGPPHIILLIVVFTISMLLKSPVFKISSIHLKFALTLFIFSVTYIIFLWKSGFYKIIKNILWRNITLEQK